ncbi:MAG: hypothetical protein J3Q66DRAFT_341831 [Benniella sp.]|nr:MAG: hypothetical protein J3Q66DRAFT_341831 [Benniella sp.]
MSLEAAGQDWAAAHDLVWAEGDYYMAQKISIREGVAHLRRGRRYIFVEPVLGPAAPYLVQLESALEDGHSSHNPHHQERHDHSPHHDTTPSTEHAAIANGNGTDIAVGGTESGSEQGHSVEDKDQNDDHGDNTADSTPPTLSPTSPPTSTTSTTTNSALRPTDIHHGQEDTTSSKLFEPYSPLLDPSTDGQDKFEYGLYELHYIPKVQHLLPHQFLPTRQSFLVHLDEDRPTLASPVPPHSKRSECRCQLMMRKALVHRDLLQVWPPIPPVHTVLERLQEAEEEARIIEIKQKVQKNWRATLQTQMVACG